MILASNPLFCFEPFESIMNKIQSNFEGWEFLAEAKHGWDHRNKIYDALSTSDMTIQIHAPFNDLNIMSMNSKLRKASINEIVRALDMGNVLDVNVITIHPGIYSPLGKYWDGTEKALMESLEQISLQAEERGIKLALENMPAPFPTAGTQPEEISSILSQLNIGFCLDIGHAFTSGKLKKFLNLEPINLHLHDNNGHDDLHLPLGDGKIDFEMVIKKMKGYKGNRVIEGRSLGELKKSKEYLRELLSTL